MVYFDILLYDLVSDMDISSPHFSYTQPVLVFLSTDQQSVPLWLEYCFTHNAFQLDGYFLSRNILVSCLRYAITCLQNTIQLKPSYIVFGVVCIDSAIVVCIHSAILQLLLTRRVSYC